MAARSGDRRLVTDDSGLLVVETAPGVRERPAPGARLRKELAALDVLQGEEARKHAEARRALDDEIKRKADERAELQREANRLASEVEGLRARLGQLPDEAADRTQRTTDRMGALGRVLRAEVHVVNEMLDAYAQYQADRRRWAETVARNPDLEEGRRLLEFHTASPEAIVELPDVLRDIIERRLVAARSTLAEYGDPARPAALAPVYACVTPSTAGGSVVLTVLPAACDALREGHSHAGFVAEVLAAMCGALLEETDADAPVLVCPAEDDPLRGAVVVGATCGTDALDAELFGVRLQELLAASHMVGVEVHPIIDAALAGGLGEVIRRKAEGR